MSLLIERPGLLTTIQDSGRLGQRWLGIPPSGVMDPPSAMLANFLVGNHPNAALLKITLAGLSLCCQRDSWIAITGADLTPTLEGIPLPMWRPVRIKAGSILEFKWVRYGCRAYMAIEGGICAPKILGSCSIDSKINWADL